MWDLLRKPATLWSVATIMLTAVVFGVLVEIISWEQLPKALVIAILIVGFLVAGFLYYYGYVRYKHQKIEHGIQPIVIAKDKYPDIEVTENISDNLAVLEVKNIGSDANFTATAKVVKGILPTTTYTMCWNSPPHLEHPIKKGGTPTIIVAEVEKATAELAGRVRGGLLLYQIGLSGEIEKVGATTQELRNTVELNIRYPSMAKPVDDSCTIEITITSTPPLLNTFENRKYIVKIDHERGHTLLIAPLPELETHIKLELGKLLLDRKEILVDLEKMNGQLDALGAASAELKFEIWYKDVSKTLQNTDYDRLWFENKEGLDYRTARKSDYIEACKYGLGRLEYIKQLMFDRGDYRI